MKYYITSTGDYYEGDQVFNTDIEVTQRPSYLYKYNRETSQWGIDPVQENEDLKRQIADLDNDVIRIIDDLFTVLKNKNIIVDEDFNTSVITKLTNRRNVRDRIL
jgi:hypothetical protein